MHSRGNAVVYAGATGSLPRNSPGWPPGEVPPPSVIENSAQENKSPCVAAAIMISRLESMLSRLAHVSGS